MSNDGDDERRIAERRPALPPEQILREILQVEQQRIDRDNRRTAVMEKTRDIADKQDQRQFDWSRGFAIQYSGMPASAVVGALLDKGPMTVVRAHDLYHEVSVQQ